MYVLLSGRLPFYARNDSDIIAQVKAGEYRMEGEVWDRVSPQAKDLLKKMLEYDPSQRISANEALSDEWIVSQTVEYLPDPSNALKNLMNFHVDIKFQHAVLTFIAYQLVRKDQSEHLAELFRSMDEDGDGKLSKEELLKAYSQVMPPDQAEFEVENIFNHVDVDFSGYIDYTEFIMASVESNTMICNQNLETAFKEFDRDNNGKISAHELREIFESSSEVPENIWRELLMEADTNGDGEIDLEEFKVLMIKLFSDTNFNNGLT